MSKPTDIPSIENGAATLRFADYAAPRREPFPIRDLIDEICGTLAAQIAAQRIQVDVDVPLGESLHADRRLLRVCVQNLMQNALDVMPGGGHLVITSYKGASAFELEVADSGPGLPREIRKRAFEPYFTTKAGAAGLGLAVVSRIVTAHRGDILAHNCPEGGAAFTLRIPSRAWEAAA